MVLIMLKNKYTNSKKLSQKRSKWMILLGVLLVLVCAVGVLQLTHAIHLLGNPQPKDLTGTTASEETKGEPKASKAKPNSDSAQSTSSATIDGTKDTGTPRAAAVALDTPSGNFVSSHHVAATDSVTSACNTNPGATCTLTFTNGSTIKSLPTKSADAGGAAYWNWTPQSIGLSTGTWQIKATASQSGQQQSANDALSLEVSR
jgi:cytoskeletal protein RodZ